MLIYFLVFITSVFFYRLGVKKDKINYFFILISICIPSFLAACRDPEIGRDINLYVLPIWESAVSSYDLSQFIFLNINNEILYLLLNYFISRFTSEFSVYLFIHQAILMSLIVMTSLKVRHSIKSDFVLIFYFFYLYNTTFSMMRQSLSVLLVLYFSLNVFYLNPKFSLLKNYLGTFVALLAHNSAVFAFLLYPLKKIINFYSNKKIALFIIVTVVFFIIYLLYNVLLSYLIGTGILSMKYENYLDQTEFSSHKIDLLCFVIITIAIFFFTTKNNRIIDKFNYTLFLLIISFYLTALGNIVEVANRVAYYFVMPLLYLLPMISKHKSEIFKIKIVIIFLLIVRFVYLALSTGLADTIPYRSNILGI